MVTIDFKLGDIKLDSSEAYLLELGELCRGTSKLLHFL